jgi:hypothetical protein
VVSGGIVISVAVSAVTISWHMECWVAGVYCIITGGGKMNLYQELDQTALQ